MWNSDLFRGKTFHGDGLVTTQMAIFQNGSVKRFWILAINTRGDFIRLNYSREWSLGCRKTLFSRSDTMAHGSCGIKENHWPVLFCVTRVTRVHYIVFVQFLIEVQSATLLFTEIVNYPGVHCTIFVLINF